MAALTVRLGLLLTWLLHSDCEEYSDRPKIKTINGDLILEPAYGKNIHIQPIGPKSSVFIGQINVLNISTTVYKKLPVSQELTQPFSDKASEDWNRKIEQLEAITTTLSFDIYSNISIMRQRINLLNNRVRFLQRLLIKKDDCQSHPCVNGGTCLNLANGYYCLCPFNWKGVNCDEDVDECRNYAGTDLGCQNDARCINRPGSYECLCKSGWYGLNCRRRAKDCLGGNYEMCGHGTCISVTTGEGIMCICDQGWTTNGTDITCQTDVNECESGKTAHCSVNPKVKCINLPGSFRCEQCPIGYEGDGYICNDIDECETLPNGGCSTNPSVSCHNTIGSRICGSCPPGYQGNGVICIWRGLCSINRGGCHPSASCVEITRSVGQGVQCICPHGLVGDGIGLQGCYLQTSDNNTQSCESNPCGFHGYCLPHANGFNCICHRGYSGVRCDKVSDSCSIHPCLNGGTCRVDEMTVEGFKCECTALHSGNLCQLNSQPCGGVVEAEEGSLTYPNTNTTYMHNSRCAWVIHTKSDKVINVTFSKFNLENSSDCLYDFVQIHDGRNSAGQLIGRFCGNKFPNNGNIISSHNNLYFWFRSDQSVAKDGFALHWTSVSPVCGGAINATIHGHLSSPGSPGNYPPNRDCYWHLSAPLGKRIRLYFFEFDIEIHVNCSYDYLAIYDGPRSTAPLLGKYCNSTQPAPIESAGSDILIHFHSDEYASGKGFQIAYASINGVPGCGGLYTRVKGEITSPSYNGISLNNLLCEYKIKTRPGTKIHYVFESFSLERSLRCVYDSLKIYDGPSTESRLVGQFCGKSVPNSFTSSSNSLYLIFKSTIGMVSQGFKMRYEAICLKTIIGDSGILTSPGYPITSQKHITCEYIISTSPGKSIQLEFQDFDIKGNFNPYCQSNSVEIRDGPTVTASLLGRYCGGSKYIHHVEISSHNYMYIKFTSDNSITGRGFYANFTTIEIECGGIYKQPTYQTDTDSVGIINHPPTKSSMYANKQNCTWILIAPLGMNIKLTWNRFELEETPSCTSDYVKLFEIDNKHHNTTLGQYCGHTLPPTLTTSTNHLVIQFNSDANIKDEGFSLSYSFLNETAHCDGYFVQPQGYINSPGWPRSYKGDLDCTWIITMPVGQQIVLNINNFDLDQSTSKRCQFSDYLEIRDGPNKNSPIIGKYCSYFKSKRIVSTSNSIYLHFQSNLNLSGKGFQIEWDGSLQGCGGTLSSAQGYISSPNYPQNYNENTECFYKIVVSSGSRIRISFTDLDLQRTTGCKNDYVEIFDGRDSNAPSYGRHCYLTDRLNNIETTSNYAFIKFRSDIFIGGKGFILNYNTICINNISGRYGVIESPGYPNNYPRSSHCVWTITVPKGNLINSTFTHFDIRKFRGYDVYEPYYYNPLRYASYDRLLPSKFYYPNLNLNRNREDACGTDYFQYKDTSNTNISEKLCGNTLPQAISSKTNSLEIKFMSGSLFSRTGFRLEWVSYGCGGHIQKRFGTFKLERNRNSDSEIECEWLIETPIGTSAYVTITDLFLYESKDCSLDAVEIYNGQSSSFPLLTKVCSQEKILVQANSNIVLIKLVKQSSRRDIYFASNFNSYHAQCGGNIESPSGFIYSENYPSNYENKLDCVWLITVPKNHRIELNFVDIDLYSSFNKEDNSEDCGDNIKIYDGDNLLQTNFSKIICPQSNVTQFISSLSSVMVQFTTDAYGTAKGFKANFTMTCGAVINATNDGIISNNKFISRSNRNCTWNIHAPELYQKVKLTIQHISLPRPSNIKTNRHCPSSYVRVFDGNDVQSPLIDEYCGQKIPAMIVSHGSALTVQLGSYTDVINGHFSAHYSTLTNACGGSLTSEKGSIASPNYPQSYPIDSNCEWTLSTSSGNRVSITFEYFDLDDSENCNEDFVEIREKNAAGNLLGVYCGQGLPSNSTTATQLYIKFHSDSLTGGRGFLLHYEFLHGNDIIGLHNGEITSPLYPNLYYSQGEYTWRIFTIRLKTIILTIDRLEIQNNGEECTNELRIYDGYDEDAPVLDEICGILKRNTKVLKTSSSVVFIKLILDESNKGSLFHIKWAESDRSSDVSDIKSITNCGGNRTELVPAYKDVIISSPNYPQNYNNDLNCEWIFQSDVGRHLRIIIFDLYLEETPGCFADYVSIYSSIALGDWTPVKENICLVDDAYENIESLLFTKVLFKTDSLSTRKGFIAKVTSECGGQLFEKSGIIEATSADDTSTICDWTVKVRPGHTIKIYFEYFNITNYDEKCETYVLIKNGASNDSPFLGNGKYCGYSHENQMKLISSGNYVFVRFVTQLVLHVRAFHKIFKLRYEEVNIECGATSSLDIDHSWEVINSPNYPSVPTPYTECIWVFTVPPGEIIRVDFIDRFDLEPSKGCVKESVEIRDGQSRLSPLLGILCQYNVQTIKTSSNSIFIKYSTQLAEPRNGFKAKISIDVCGGTLVSESAEITSPSYPHMLVLPSGTVCKWHIISVPQHVIKIEFKDINIPETDIHCKTNVSIEESIPSNAKLVGNSKTLCGNDNFSGNSTYFESVTNSVIIKLNYGVSSKSNQVSNHRGFKLTFTSSKKSCGSTIQASEGFLTTPGYPGETSLRFCKWVIILPDTNRRVRLELIDQNSNQIAMAFNDNKLTSAIEEYTDPTSSRTSRIYESSGNILVFCVLLPFFKSNHRLKAKFSSDEPSLCGGVLNLISKELLSPDIQRGYVCEWTLKNIQSVSDNSSEFKTVHFTIQTSSMKKNNCRFQDSRVSLYFSLTKDEISFQRNFCGNLTDISYRIPLSNIKIKAFQYKKNPLFFNIKWKLQPCGGILHITEESINILNIPEIYYDTIDCAWVLVSSYGIRVEIKLEGTFKADCSDEFIQISLDDSPTVNTLANYCKNELPDHAFVSSYKYTYIQYHSIAQNRTDLKLMAKTTSGQCGGYLSMFNRVFTSPNYPKNYFENQECTWEIQAEFGFRVSLQFVERFLIEDRANCTKDVIIIYDWENNIYLEKARLCGRRIPPIFNSTFNQMKVVFRTDATINLDGFKAKWSPICGGEYLATEKEQYLHSPGYNYEYKPLLSCTYKISSTSSKQVMIQFLDFDLEGSYPECKYDNLTITASNNYNSFHAMYCEKVLPPKLNDFRSVTLLFMTDRFKQNKGFKLSYSTYSCGGKITNATVLSITPSEYYGKNQNCTWEIQTTENKVVILKFQYMDIESSYECYNNYVAVYNGPTINPKKRLSLMCGHTNSSTVIKSTTNKAILEVITSSYYHSLGFKVVILFSYSPEVGCGGEIILVKPRTRILKSPLIENPYVYDNYVDCLWKIKAVTDGIIKVNFTSFHVAPCSNVNQTAIGSSQCDCDFVEVKDGLNPNNLVIGTYCGHTLPPQLLSSGYLISIRFSTDGELTSSGFEAVLSSEPSLCGPSTFIPTKSVQRILSPGYESASIPRGLHCSYYIDTTLNPYSPVLISIRNLDLQSGKNNKCDTDKLVIHNSKPRNVDLNKNYINNNENSIHRYSNVYDLDVRLSSQIVLCGLKNSLDFYVTGNVYINLITSFEASSLHKGVEIEVSYSSFCNKNYSESQGRIQNTMEPFNNTDTNCYTLITAPDNYTISLYFMSVTPIYGNKKSYLEFFDGNTTTAPLVLKIMKNYLQDIPIFSNGRYLLLHNFIDDGTGVIYDLNYMITDKGRGCGGKMSNEIGKISSPLYPEVYRKKSICEWELETPSNTRLLLHFSVFDLGIVCDQNYLQLVDRDGNIISTYCSETPADYTSNDNYVKIVFTTTKNNGGTGWVTDFVGTV